MEEISIVHHDRKFTELHDITRFSRENISKVRDFQKTFPDYSITPLVPLDNLAKKLGISNIYIKDESYRFGQNSFKPLGGTYCIGSILAKKLNIPIKDLSYNDLVSPETQKKTGQQTFITSSDGNWGRAVAYTTYKLGHKSIVYMPKGTAQERLDNIRKFNCDASIYQGNYDEAAKQAQIDAEKNGYTFVQDSAYEGFEEIPGYIMEGYCTMALEALEQLEKINKKPTHIFLQAGVGAMAGAICAFFAHYYGPKERPICTIVEPTKANCVYLTAQANDGKMRIVTGDMDSIMAGLACGVPCSLSVPIFRDYAENYLSIPDYVAAKGMRVLGCPLRGDTRIISGESGAATSGAVFEVLMNDKYKNIKDVLKLDENSVVLCFSTEGDTFFDEYLDICWDGKFESYKKE